MPRWPDGFGPSALSEGAKARLKLQALDGAIDYPACADLVDGLLAWILHRLEAGNDPKAAALAPEVIEAIAIGLGRRLQWTRLRVEGDDAAYYAVKRELLAGSGF